MLRSSLSTATSRIIFFLNNITSKSQLHQIQSQIVIGRLRTDTTIGSHFITACQSLDLLNVAHELFFSQIFRPHVYICNHLIRSFCLSKTPGVPFGIYARMHRNSISPNNYTFPFLLKSLADFYEVNKGLCVHTHVLKLGYSDDIFVGNSLLSLYSSDMDLCRKLFDEMTERDVVSWTVLISGYNSCRKYDEALISFEEMLCAGLTPNRVTMVNALAACAKHQAYDLGIWIHEFIRKNELELDEVLGTALIDMYARCGRIKEGLLVFHSMKVKNAITWNIIIRGFGVAKKGDEAVSWFYRMRQEGIKPDGVTLVEVLSACGNSGLVNTGKEIFCLLENESFGFKANANHYHCMIDLLVRAGCLDEAFSTIEKMPFVPRTLLWGSLLAGCRAHRNYELSVFAAKKLVELEEHNSKHYSVLCEIYAEMGRWNDVENVRKMIRDRGLVEDQVSGLKLLKT